MGVSSSIRPHLRKKTNFKTAINMSFSPIIISGWFPKGGVAKTISAYNMGYFFAKNGYKTILVDADVQCSLTKSFLYQDDGTEDVTFENEMYEIYKEGQDICLNIGASIDTVLSGNRIEPPMVQATHHKILKDQLLLLPGSISSITELETILNYAEQGKRPIDSNKPGCFMKMVEKTAKNYGAQIVIIDTGTPISTLNMIITMSSNYTYIPIQPDLFSIFSLESYIKLLSQDFRSRYSDLVLYTKHSKSPLPDTKPKFIGVLLQNFMSYGPSNSSAYNRNIKVIKENIEKAGIMENTSIIETVPNFDNHVIQAQTMGIPIIGLETSSPELEMKIKKLNDIHRKIENIVFDKAIE